MLLIVGLGNPGRDYERHRHNVGAMALDAIHRRHGFPPWRKRFSAEIAEGSLGGAKTILMKPTTFMNESGRAVGDAARFHKLTPADILVIHDELDLPAGKTRLKSGGGGAGHNGIRSLTAHLGADYRRLRIGIGHPGHREQVHGYVLHDFAKGDAEWLDPLLDAIAADAPLLAAGKDAEFANRIHLATQPVAVDEALPPKAKKTKPLKAETASSDVTSEPVDSQSDVRPAAGPTPNAPPRGGPFAGLRRLFGGKS